MTYTAVSDFSVKKFVPGINITTRIHKHIAIRTFAQKAYFAIYQHPTCIGGLNVYFSFRFATLPPEVGHRSTYSYFKHALKLNAPGNLLFDTHPQTFAYMYQTCTIPGQLRPIHIQ